MREQITPDRIANSIRLLRSDHEGVFLIVEGHSDKLIYERLVNKQEVRVTIASGKNNAIKALSILEKENFRRVVAVIDADFSRIEQQIPDSNNLFLTDEHDLEMMLIKSAAFDKLLKERGSEEKIAAFPKDIRETLLKLGQEIGKLRLLSLRNKLDLKFEGLKFGKFIDKEKLNLSIDIDELIRSIKNHSQKLSLDEQQIKQDLSVISDENHDPWQLCCGHDFISILAIALWKVLGTRNANDVKKEDLERELRLAYELSYFYQTQIYQLMVNWQSNNHPYQIF
jgi:5S rRNA maturation endonuclease (ribonuclease M5)